MFCASLLLLLLLLFGNPSLFIAMKHQNFVATNSLQNGIVFVVIVIVVVVAVDWANGLNHRVCICLCHNTLPILLSANYSWSKTTKHIHIIIRVGGRLMKLSFIPCSFHPLAWIFLDAWGYLEWLIASTGHKAMHSNRLQYNYYNVPMSIDHIFRFFPFFSFFSFFSSFSTKSIICNTQRQSLLHGIHFLNPQQQEKNRRNELAFSLKLITGQTNLEIALLEIRMEKF